MRTFVFSIVAILQFNLCAQLETEITNEVIHVSCYGMEEKQTVQLAQELIALDYIILFDNDNTLDIRNTIDYPNAYLGGQEPQCIEYISPLYQSININNIYGVSSNRICNFDEPYFKNSNRTKYDSIVSNLKIESTICEHFGSIDSSSIISICNTFIEAYNLSSQDSIILMMSVHGINYADSVYFKNAGLEKKVAYFHQIFNNSISLEAFKEFDNKIILTPFKSSSEVGNSIIKARNCIAGRRKLNEFELISQKKLPNTISISSKLKIKSKDWSDTKFIFVNEIRHCMY